LLTDDGSDPSTLNDARLAAHAARRAGELLLALRQQAAEDRWSPWKLEEAGDAEANRLLCRLLAEHRPDDVIFSEEQRDDGSRLEAKRVWIIDPLDGSYDYGDRRATNYAVHVALVAEGQPVAGAVSIPELGSTLCTDDSFPPVPDATATEAGPVIISGRSTAALGIYVANALGGRTVVAGSAGFKAMAVVQGTADVYLHPSGLYEWDACAPAAVAAAAGLSVTDIRGRAIEYNKPIPEVAGLVIARPELLNPVLELLG
jgi:3'(2'), 5'-bisphosphate nucleotidase